MVYGYVSAIILLVIALAGITLEKAYFYLPLKELERRAAKGDLIARRLAHARRYGDELRSLLVTCSWLAAAIGVAILARLSPPLIAVTDVALVLVYLFFWQLRAPLSAFGARFAAANATWLAWVVTRSRGVLRFLARPFTQYHLRRTHTGLYERADLIDLLERQGRQHDNRIPVSELERAKRVLSADDLRVDVLMTPRAHVRVVNATDQLSPILINELHQTGQKIFPVYEGKRSNIVGLLRLEAVADIQQHGAIAEAMSQHLAYLSQDSTLEQAVRAHYETHETLFIVLNPKGEYVGILTMDTILSHLFGPLDQLTFGHFDDPEAVANKGVAKKPTEVVK